MGENKPIVGITAGHGGRDRGADGLGYVEADLTIELRDLITKELHTKGYQVWNDRNESTLTDTVQEAGAAIAKGGILLDIHWNAFYNSKANGSEVFVSSNAWNKTRAL